MNIKTILIPLLLSTITCAAQRPDLVAKEKVRDKVTKADKYYRKAYDSLSYWETRYVKSKFTDKLANKMRWYYKFREKSRKEYIADSIFRPDKRRLFLPFSQDRAHRHGGPSNQEMEYFTNHHIIMVVPAEYKTWYQMDDSTIWAWNNGSTFPVQYPTPSNMRASAGAFNFLVAICGDTGHVYNSAPNFNTDPSTNMYRIPLDTNGADFGGNVFVDAYGQMIITIKADGTVWFVGTDYFNLFYTGGDPLLETGAVMKPTQLSPNGMVFKKVLIGGNKIIGLTTAGAVYEWFQNGSRTPTLLTTPQPAVDIFVSHDDVAGCIVPDPGETSGMGYPYIFGTAYGMWGGSGVLTSLTSLKLLWQMSSPVKVIKCNWNTIHYIDSLGTLHACGFNSQGEVGNGVEFIGRYTYPTFPGYIWPFNDLENPSGTPVQLGTATNWTNVWTNNWYTFYNFYSNSNDSIFSNGRNKAGVLGNGMDGGFVNDPNHSNILDVLSPTMVHPFQSPFTVYNVFIPAIVNCPRQTVGGSTANLVSFDTATRVAVTTPPALNGIDTAGYEISTFQWSVLTKPSGAPAPVFGTPTAQNTVVSGLVPGVYTFQMLITDNHSGSQIGIDTITVNSSTQSETHVFHTYDTTLSQSSSSVGSSGIWHLRITAPVGMFGNGPDTASRPLILFMPGKGQNGSNNSANFSAFGPHYWLQNGWDGSIHLGNGTHYPIIITAYCETSATPNPSQLYLIVNYIINTYHVKRNSIYGTGFSEGAFTVGGIIEFENTLGDQAGMKLFKSLAMLEGTPTPPSSEFPVARPMPCSTTWCDTTYYKTWVNTYHGRYFYLEGNGSDNFRDGWHYATAMNNSVPSTAYFSYENLGDGAHCCWNSMYDPSATDWNCVTPPALGPNNAPSQAGTNQMGNYRIGQNLFTWMFSQGDTSIVSSAGSLTVTAGNNQTITQPTNSVTLSGTAAPPVGGSISSILWSQVSGPSVASFGSATSLTTTANNLFLSGVYVFQMKASDNTGDVDSAQVQVVVNAGSCRAFTWSGGTNINITNSALGANPVLHACDTVYIPAFSGGYRSISISGIGAEAQGGYIHIIAKPGAFIKPNSSGNLFANNFDNNNWVHLKGINMSDHTDALFSTRATTAQSHFIWFDSLTLHNMSGIFSQATIGSSLPQYTGSATDTVNMNYHWIFSNIDADTIGSTSNGGLSTIWLGSMNPGDVWDDVEISNCHFSYNPSPAPSGPADFIHLQNAFDVRIHDNTFDQLGVVNNPQGHAGAIDVVHSQFNIYHNVWTHNFGDGVRAISQGWIPTLKAITVAKRPDFDGVSRFWGNIMYQNRKYSMFEDQYDTVLQSPIIPEGYVARRSARVWNNTMYRGGVGVGNSPYNLSVYDWYFVNTGLLDTVELHNNLLVGPPNDTVQTVNLFALLTRPNGGNPTYDTSGNQFSQLLVFSNSGLADTSLSPLGFYPKFQGILYNNGVLAPSWLTTDIHGQSVPGTVFRSPFNRSTYVDVGASQYLFPSINVINSFLRKPQYHLKWISN